MIVKAENHLLHRPMNNFAVPQTYGGLNFLQSLLHAWDKCTVSLLLLFIFQFWISMFLIEKISKPIASLVMSGANLGLDGNCWENMPIIGRELNGGQL